MKAQKKVNVIDLLLQRCGLVGHGKLTRLGELFEVDRQTVNGWKVRNSIPREHCRQAKELGLEWEELYPEKTVIPEADTHACVPMKVVINDPTHYIEIARGGTTVEVTVSGKTVAKITGASVAA